MESSRVDARKRYVVIQWRPYLVCSAAGPPVRSSRRIVDGKAEGVQTNAACALAHGLPCAEMLPLVVDMGRQSTRVGFAGNDTPPVIVPTVRDEHATVSAPVLSRHAFARETQTPLHASHAACLPMRSRRHACSVWAKRWARTMLPWEVRALQSASCKRLQRTRSPACHGCPHDALQYATASPRLG
ncbi:hypothetical protein EON68_04035 [archaeon]|nr:MAG: hypothetical protein EON68_04035 [archaeon]